MNPILSFIIIALIVFSIPLFVMRYGKSYLIGLVPIYLITGNVFAESFFSVGGMIQSLAVPIYSGIFLVTDLLSEHYGKKESSKAVWMGFLAQVLFVLILFIITNTEILPDNLNKIKTMFSLIPRLVLGSMVAYLVSQFLDLFLFHTIKQRTTGLFWRNNMSTIISQFVDTTVFAYIAFLGVAPFDTTGKLWTFIITTWIFKIIVALFDFPFIYASTKIYRNEQ